MNLCMMSVCETACKCVSCSNAQQLYNLDPALQSALCVNTTAHDATC